MTTAVEIVVAEGEEGKGGRFGGRNNFWQGSGNRHRDQALRQKARELAAVA